MAALLTSLSIAVFGPASSAYAANCGDVLVGGSAWAGGNGVDVHFNGVNQGTGNSCAGSTAVFNLGASPPRWGLGWQCVELAARLYKTKGWSNGLPGVMYAAEIYTKASDLGMTAMGQGAIDITQIVPGDMVISNQATYGHVSVVSSVDVAGNKVHTVEQNASNDGWATYDYNATTKKLTRGSYYSVTGVVHDADNTLTNGSGNQTPPAVPWHFENLEGDPGAVSSHNSDVGRTPTAVEFNGQLYVFHFDANYGDLRYARTSPGWVFDILDGAGGSNNRTTSRVGEGATAVVFNNQLHVFYYDSGAGNLRHAVSSNGVYWTFENLDGDWGSLGGLDGNIGQTPVAIVFGTSLQVFYYDAGRGNLRHAWFSGASWYFENLEGDPGSISHYDTNIGLDPTAVVHGSTLQLFYYDVAAGNLRHTWADGSGWHFENLDGDSGSIGGLNANVGSHPSTVIYGGNLHVFYYDQTNGNFRHMWADAVGWHAENLEGDVGSVSGYNGDVGTMSTAVVVGNTLQVFVYEAGLGNLRHLLDDGTGWKWENFDGQGGSPAGRLNANVGLDPIVTTFGGGLQLFYYDYEHGDLRHAVPQ